MLSASELVPALAIVLVAATIMGLLGFGMGMVISPILLLMIEPQSVVTTINALSALVLVPVLFQTRGYVAIRRVLPLAVAGLLAVPVGVLILSSASPGTLRITIAVIILVLAIPSAFNLQRPLPRPGIIGPGVGFLGAMLVTGFGVGIPLVALFFVNQRWNVGELRASVAIYYMAVTLGALILYSATGLFTVDRLVLAASLTPAVPVGLGLSTLLMRRMDDRMLRHILLVVIILASLGLLGREIAGL